MANSAWSPSSFAIQRCSVHHIRLLPDADPEDPVGEGPANFQIARERVGEHALADAAHALYADARRCPGDDHGRLEIDQQGITQHAQPIRLGAVVHRQRWHRNEFAKWRRGIGELPHEVGQMLGVAGAVAKILRVDELQLLGNQGVAIDRASVGPLPIVPDDGIDTLAHLQGAAPFLRDIVRLHCLRANHEEESVVRSDGVANLLIEGQLSRRHRDPVEPDGEAGLRQVIVQPTNEHLIVVARARRGTPSWTWRWVSGSRW